jgi:peptide/nickel transport system permease protein
MPSSIPASKMLVDGAPSAAQRNAAEPGRKRLVTAHARDAWRKFLGNPRVWFGLTTLVVVVTLALLAPWIAPTGPEDMELALRLKPPSLAAAADLLGRDLNGGSVLTSMLYGARTSLYISFLTVLLSVTVGTAVGLIAGYKRGAYDMILMRFVDLLMAFPGILLAMALAALMGPSRHNVILAISATGWTSAARLIRGQTLSVREREFVQASVALGATDLRTIVRHVFPSTLSPLLVHATFSLSGVILVEASLSFLGLGANDGAPSWGAILGQGRTVLTEAPFLSIVPGAAIAMLVLALNFLGDALRDLLDPRALR